MYYRWTFMPAGTERSRSLALIAARGVHDYTDRDLYTFGVYTGESPNPRPTPQPLALALALTLTLTLALTVMQTQGESLKFWLERLTALGVTHGPMWGFDSFEGLPAEAEGKVLESNVAAGHPNPGPDLGP